MALLAVWLGWGIALAGPAPSLSSSDAGERARAARLAGERGDRHSASRLLQLLDDPSWRVRAAAARALGLLHHQPAKRPLMVRAQTDGSARVRQAAAEAVQRLDPRGFVAVLATADPPPVRPAPPPPPPPAWQRPGRALLLGLGLGADALRADHSLAGQVLTGLRWRHAEAQLSLSFPALALAGQLRWSVVPAWPVVPIVTLGGAVSYNNRQEDALGPAASLFAGAGIRLGPYGDRPLWRRLYGTVELLATWVVLQGRPASDEVELERFALPLLASVGLELWP